MFFLSKWKALSRFQQESVLGQMLCNIFINDQDDGIEDVIIEFVFEMKLEGTGVLFWDRV